MTHDELLAEHHIRRLAERYLAGTATDHTVAIVLPEWMHPSIGNLTAWALFGRLVHAVEIGDDEYADRILRALVTGRRRPADDADGELLAVAYTVGVVTRPLPNLTLLEG